MDRRHDVVVVGGGQAGLAMGYHLARTGLTFVILDASPAPGHVWSTRWDSLKLFTPARYSSLPGLRFPGDPEHYPTKDAVADYLRAYVAELDLPVRFGAPVLSLRPLPGEAGFQLETPLGAWQAQQVVVATGPFQRPRIPRLEGSLHIGVLQLHSSEYRNPAQLPPGEVLVVGAGNSGVQIAAELAATRPTTLAVGERLLRLPERLLGRSLFWYLEKAGMLKVSVDSRLGRKASRRETLIGQGPDDIVRRYGVSLVDRAVRADRERIHFRGGAAMAPAAVIWATGFRSDYQWVHAPVLDERGLPVHRRGITATPGLYFLGLPWQHTRGSALIGWVGQDAGFLAERIIAMPASSAAPGVPSKR